MSDPIWPVWLPQSPEVDSYQDEEDPSAVLRTPMDAGVAKMRQRYSFVPYLIRCTYPEMTSEQRELLIDFHRLTVKRVLPFLWPRPPSYELTRVRFVTRPTFRPLSGGYWAASLQLETRP